MDAHPTNGSSGSGSEEHGEADNDAPRVANGGVANGASRTRRVARAGDQVTG
jgi:hypothetical protein